MAWSCSQARQLTPRHYRRKNVGQGYHGREKTELLHDMIEGRDYGQLKDLISDRRRQDSKLECTSETQKPAANSRRLKKKMFTGISLAQLSDNHPRHKP